MINELDENTLRLRDLIELYGDFNDLVNFDNILEDAGLIIIGSDEDE
jgi:hypothetical protein